HRLDFQCVVTQPELRVRFLHNKTASLSNQLRIPTFSYRTYFRCHGILLTSGARKGDPRATSASRPPQSMWRIVREDRVHAADRFVPATPKYAPETALKQPVYQRDYAAQKTTEHS
ncbi:hypothetical protein H5411_45510, partial [Amycolatopsis echigonensis]